MTTPQELPNDMVERVAARLWFEHVDRHGYPNGLPRWDELPQGEPHRETALADARAAIEAMREPTEAMIDAYFDRCRELGFTAHINATAAWSAMITAACLRAHAANLERDNG